MIRMAAENDWAAVHHLIEELESCSFSKEVFTQLFQELIRNENHVVFLWENGNTVVGMLHLRMEYQLHHCGRIAEIMELCVLPEYRSQGIGAQLLFVAEKLARESHCIQIEVTSSNARTRAHQFYQQAGMQKTHCKLTKILE